LNPLDKILVLLMGPQGSGKTTYCLTHLADYLRISQDEQGRGGHWAAFEEAVKRGERRIVVDRINPLRYQRKRYLALAKEHGYFTHIVWLNVDRELCLRRIRERGEHPTLRVEEAERALSHYFDVLKVPSRLEADRLEILGKPPRFVPVEDLRESIGSRRHIIVGDVHGCFDELKQLLDLLDFNPSEDVLVSVGDIIDRGPKVRETVEFVLALPHFHMVLGNHEDKLLRWAEGRKVTIGHGLQETIDAFGGALPENFAALLRRAPLILRTPSGFVVHAGFDPEMSAEEQGRSDCIYMRYYGGRGYMDEINGTPWFRLWPKDGPRVFFGHEPMESGPIEGSAISLDGGCVFGGNLRAFDSRDGKVHAIAAKQVYVVNQKAGQARPATLDEPQQREAYVKLGLLRSDRTDDGRLAVYTYTDQCVYTNAWDDVTRNARGHVYDLQTGECVAWAFPKFFNLNENAETQTDQLPWDQPYEIYEKLDGWLGVLYRHDGQFKVSTRGSFHSSGARWATAYIQQFDLSCLPNAATLCFEVIHPEHQIILTYEKESLTILGAFNRFTREEYPRHVVEEWAERTGLPIVPLLAHRSLTELLHEQKEIRDREGFVIRFHDGRRVKVKTAWYLEMARIMNDLTPISVWRSMRQGRVPEEYLSRIPEELRPLADKYRAVLEGQYAQVLLHIEQTAEPFVRDFGHDRREYAKQVELNAERLGYVRKAMFLLLDGKRDKLEGVIMDRIFPKGNHFAAP
jgi:RNA ligase